MRKLGRNEGRGSESWNIGRGTVNWFPWAKAGSPSRALPLTLPAKSPFLLLLLLLLLYFHFPSLPLSRRLLNSLFLFSTISISTPITSANFLSWSPLPTSPFSSFFSGYVSNYFILSLLLFLSSGSLFVFIFEASSLISSWNCNVEFVLYWFLFLMGSCSRSCPFFCFELRFRVVFNFGALDLLCFLF